MVTAHRARGLAGYDILAIGELNVDLLLYGENVVPVFEQADTLVDNAVLTVGFTAMKPGKPKLAVDCLLLLLAFGRDPRVDGGYLQRPVEFR